MPAACNRRAAEASQRRSVRRQARLSASPSPSIAALIDSRWHVSVNALVVWTNALPLRNVANILEIRYLIKAHEEAVGRYYILRWVFGSVKLKPKQRIWSPMPTGQSRSLVAQAQSLAEELH